MICHWKFGSLGSSLFMGGSQIHSYKKELLSDILCICSVYIIFSHLSVGRYWLCLKNTTLRRKIHSKRPDSSYNTSLLFCLQIKALEDHVNIAVGTPNRYLLLLLIYSLISKVLSSNTMFVECYNSFYSFTVG